jgi:predicted nuclease with RNAse H fold
MQLGFRLYATFTEGERVYEVFPSASYTQLFGDSSLRFEVSLAGFARGPRDVLDAYVAALTVREFEAGRGTAVGDGDALGAIILPRPVADPDSGVLNWPGNAA